MKRRTDKCRRVKEEQTRRGKKNVGSRYERRGGIQRKNEGKTRYRKRC